MPKKEGDPSPVAKHAREEYYRDLPHFQKEGKRIYVTWCTWQHWVLPESVRDLVLEHCLHDHSVKLQMHGVVVMPDHVHMIFTPLADTQGCPFGLGEILSGIKGASSHRIKKVLGRKDPVWQREYFDHILRSEESTQEKVDYICQNPVRKKLVQTEDEYPWLWREWVEGV